VDFSCKGYSKVDFRHAKILDAIFYWVLLSTTIFNDIEQSMPFAMDLFNMESVGSKPQSELIPDDLDSQSKEDR